MKSLLTSSFVVALAATAVAQTVVVPNGTAATEAASSTAYAWGRGSTQIRVQYVYDSTHFTSQGVNIPIVINQLRFRVNGAATTAGYTYNNATVQLSTAAVDYLTPSTTFASNHGPNLTTVYAGPVTVAAGAGTTPNNWYVTLPVAPFLYDPSTGGDLCLDLAHDGTGPAVTTGPAHDAMTTGSLTSRIYNLTNYLSPTGTVQQNVGIVCEFGYTPAAGLYAGFQADVTRGASPLAVNFTDQTFSSDPGGVTSWAWDFDGDNVVDSTVQNPSFVYANCGTYNVSLTVTDASHAPSTMTRTGYVVTDLIASNFTAQVVGAQTVQFTDTSNMAASTWAWDLDGDNVTDSTVQNPVWVYANTNPVNVTLTTTRLCSPPSVVTKLVVPAQQLTTNLVANNGGSSLWTVLFDVDVLNPTGVSISSFDSITATLNTAFTVDVYVKPVTYVGSEFVPAAWTKVGVASGTSNAVANQPSNSVLTAPIYLPSGTYGMALRYIGISPRYVTGASTFGNGDLSLTLGAATVTTTGPFLGTTNNTPRSWSGTLYYGTHNITGGAGYGFFAPGCAGSMGVPHLTGNRPQLGQPLNVAIDNLPLSAAIMLTGFSRTFSSFGPLPVDMTPFGAPGCLGRVSPDATLFVFGSANTANWGFTVPNDPGLSGLSMYNQALAVDPGFNVLGAVTSDATAMIIGL